MMWTLSNRADPSARAIADRHYNRQKIGAAQFVPPGRCLVLSAPGALWITSYPFAEYVKHAWAGAWVCSAFRNEGDELSSDLIRAALEATAYTWPTSPRVPAVRLRRKPDRTDLEPIEIAMITFVDASKTTHKRDPGRCFRRAGFVDVGATRGGLVALGYPASALPAPRAPLGTTVDLWPRLAS